MSAVVTESWGQTVPVTPAIYFSAQKVTALDSRKWREGVGGTATDASAGEFSGWAWRPVFSPNEAHPWDAVASRRAGVGWGGMSAHTLELSLSLLYITHRGLTAILPSPCAACTHTHTYTHTHTHTHTHIYKCAHKHTHGNRPTCTHTRMHAHTHAHTHEHTHTDTDTEIHKDQTHLHMPTLGSTPTHTHTQAWESDRLTVNQRGRGGERTEISRLMMDSMLLITASLSSLSL